MDDRPANVRRKGKEKKVKREIENEEEQLPQLEVLVEEDSDGTVDIEVSDDDIDDGTPNAVNIVKGLIRNKKIRNLPFKWHTGLYPKKRKHSAQSFCIACQKVVPTQSAVHFNTLHCEANKMNLSQLEKWALIEFSKPILESIGKSCLNLAKIRNPSTESEYQMLSEVVHQLKESGLPVYGNIKWPPENGEEGPKERDDEDENFDDEGNAFDVKGQDQFAGQAYSGNSRQERQGDEEEVVYNAVFDLSVIPLPSSFDVYTEMLKWVWHMENQGIGIKGELKRPFGQIPDENNDDVDQYIAMEDHQDYDYNRRNEALITDSQNFDTTDFELNNQAIPEQEMQIALFESFAVTRSSEDQFPDMLPLPSSLSGFLEQTADSVSNFLDRAQSDMQFNRVSPETEEFTFEEINFAFDNNQPESIDFNDSFERDDIPGVNANQQQLDVSHFQLDRAAAPAIPVRMLRNRDLVADDLLNDNDEVESSDEDESDSISTMINANKVPNNLLLINVNGRGYRGGCSVQKVFTDEPNLAVLFDSCRQETDQGYCVIRRKYKNKECIVVKMKLNITLNVYKQPLLYDFYLFVLGRCNDHINTARLYTGYLCRIVVPLLRTRGRIGAILCIDDILFSAEAISAIFDEMSVNKLSATIQHMYLAAFKKCLFFISVKINIRWIQGQRSDALKQLNLLADYLSVGINDQYRKEKFYKDDKHVPPYCMPVTLVRYSYVIAKITRIIEIFRENGFISIADYVYVSGHTMASMIHLNSSRTECTYKLTMRDVTSQRIQSYERELENGEMETFWVIRYKPPKNIRVKNDRDGQFAGYIVMDKQLKLQLDFILEVRISLQFSFNPESRVFLKEDGQPMSLPNVYINKFLEQIGQKDYDLSCSATRVAVARKDFNIFCTNLINSALERSKLYLSAGHRKDTRIKHYVRYISLAAVASFIELRRIDAVTRLENAENVAKLEQAIRMFLSNPTDARIAAEPVVTGTDNMQEADALDQDLQRGKRSATTEAEISAKRVKREPSSAVDMANVEQETTLNTESMEVEVIVYAAFEDKNSQMLRELLEEAKSTQDNVQSDADAIVAALRKHNEIPCNKFPKMKSIRTTVGAVEFQFRSKKKGVQGFEWISVYDVPGVGRGGFAKCDIPKNVIVSDYLGAIQTEDEHKLWLESNRLTEGESITVCDYRLAIKANGKSYVFTSHNDEYHGTVSLGRLFNHSLHKECINVEGRPVMLQIGRIQYLKILFTSTKKIKKGDQILWNYGKDYNVYDWYTKCPNGTCKHEKKDVMTETLPEATDVLTTRPVIHIASQEGPSASQFDLKGKQLESDEKPFDTLKLAGQYLNVEPSSFVIGESTTYLKAVVEQIVHRELAENLKDVLESEPSSWSITSLVNRLSKISDSFAIFTSPQRRSNEMRCIRVGSRAPELLLAWFDREKSFAPIVSDSLTVGDYVADKVSEKPTITIPNTETVALTIDLQSLI